MGSEIRFNRTFRNEIISRLQVALFLQTAQSFPPGFRDTSLVQGLF